MADPKETPAAQQQPIITILGSLNIDQTAYVPHHPAPGETLTANKLVVSPGGKGANQAAACAKLSRRSSPSSSASASVSAPRVRMVGAVGGDSFGTLATETLSSFGVDVSGVQVRKDCKTGIAFIVVDEDAGGENRIVLSPEANHSFAPDDADDSIWRNVFEPKPDLLVMQLEVRLDVVVEAVRRARERGVAVLLNAAPAARLPGSVFEGLEHLVVNETEARMLAGETQGSAEGKDGDGEEAARLAAVLRGKGVRNVVITLGAKGALFVGSDGREGTVAAPKVTAVDTTAAGDTFVGAYAVEYVRREGKFGIAEACRRACEAAALTVQKAGAQASIPWLEELSWGSS